MSEFDPGGGLPLALKNGLRSLVATAAAVGAGLMAVARGGGESPAELKRGDEAPDFTLPGSDGQSYHLRDFRGTRAVVVAWFPKAFTGG
jgi:thioredoxin-dependent peroxiredoxin